MERVPTIRVSDQSTSTSCIHGWGTQTVDQGMKLKVSSPGTDHPSALCFFMKCGDWCVVLCCGCELWLFMDWELCGPRLVCGFVWITV